MSATLSDGWHWWTGALHRALGHIKRPQWIKGDAPILLRLDKNGDVQDLTEAVGAASAFEMFDGDGQEDPVRKIADQKRARSAGVAIRLDPKHFFVRSVSSHILPASQLMKTANLDVQANTPFKESDVHVLGLESAGAGARYAVAKRATLDPLIAVFESSGVRLRGVDLEIGDEVARISGPALRQLTAGHQRRMQLRAVHVLGALAFSAMLTGVHFWHRNQIAIDQLGRTIEGLTAEAKITRAALDRRAASIAELTALRKTIEDVEPISAVWEELARVIPDSAYLTDLEVTDKRIVISGFAADAAALIVALEQSTTFERASFTSPVVRTPQQDAERFQISLFLESTS